LLKLIIGNIFFLSLFPPDLIDNLKAGVSAGRSSNELAVAQDFQRKAQFYLDFVEAENSTGFHAPQEAPRILAQSINFSRKGQNSPRPAAKLARSERPDSTPDGAAATQAAADPALVP